MVHSSGVSTERKPNFAFCRSSLQSKFLLRCKQDAASDLYHQRISRSPAAKLPCLQCTHDQHANVNAVHAIFLYGLAYVHDTYSIVAQCCRQGTLQQGGSLHQDLPESGEACASGRCFGKCIDSGAECGAGSPPEPTPPLHTPQEGHPGAGGFGASGTGPSQRLLGWQSRISRYALPASLIMSGGAMPSRVAFQHVLQFAPCNYVPPVVTCQDVWDQACGRVHDHPQLE